MTASNETERIARRYFEAWTRRDSETTASLLAPDFRFSAGDMQVEGREAFLSAGAFPQGAETKLLDEAYQGEVGFQLYESTSGDRSVTIAERLRVRDGKIVESKFVTDMAAFMAFVGQSTSPGDEP
jgi:ketosteroid isomerase-like protein